MQRPRSGRQLNGYLAFPGFPATETLGARSLLPGLTVGMIRSPKGPQEGMLPLRIRCSSPQAARTGPGGFDAALHPRSSPAAGVFKSFSRRAPFSNGELIPPGAGHPSAGWELILPATGRRARGVAKRLRSRARPRRQRVLLATPRPEPNPTRRTVRFTGHSIPRRGIPNPTAHPHQRGG